MNVGVSITSTFHRNGCYKNIDGIGVYTDNLFKALSNIKAINLTPVFIKSPYLIWNNKKSFFHEEPHVFLNHFLPFNIHRSLERKVDIFHVTDFRVPKLKNTPVIMTIHDALLFKNINMANASTIKLKNYFLKKHVHYVDHVITHSNAVIDEIVNYWNVDSKKISVVYPGIANNWFLRESREKINQILNYYQISRPFLLSVGTIQCKKNYTRILNAYMALPRDIRESVNLVIVGRRGEATVSEMRKIETLHREKHIQWLKYIPFEHLRILYQSGLALLFPSLNEGFGLPILEGFASQIPVLTSGFGAMKEVASNAAFFVNPYEVNSIKVGMEKLINSSSLRSDLIAKGMLRVKDFSWNSCAKNVNRIYRLFT
jgi:alpha-1,3-rhamnosyl/mannosyltransferase